MKKTVEQMAAELTEKQKDTILKVDKYGTIIVLLLTVPGMLILFIGLFAMITDTSLFSEEAFMGFIVLGALIILISIASIVFIKVKLPYYSDKIVAYIRKERKGK